MTEMRHLNNVLVNLYEREKFGVTAIQRLCKVSLTQANSIAQLGVKEDLLDIVNEYQFTLSLKGKALRETILNL